MAKLTEYTTATEFDANDILIKDGTNGTMNITVESAASQFAELATENATEVSSISDTDTVLLNGTSKITAANALSDYATKSDIPTTLANPSALTLTVNDTSYSYDGSSAVDVSITEPDLSSYATQTYVGEQIESALADYSTTEDVSTLITTTLEESTSAQMHRMIWRGENLGTSVTEAQLTAISEGTFDDLYLGDYWVIGGYTWRIMDFDYWYNIGSTAFTKHHLVIVPDSQLGTCAMNDADDDGSYSNSGAYLSSMFYLGTVATDTYALPNVITLIQGLFGEDYVLSHYSYLPSACGSSGDTSGTWTESTVDLMSEIMVYGSKIRTCNSTNATSDKTQLAGFMVKPDLITTRSSWWLRDAVSTTYFAYVSASGFAYSNSAYNSLGVRPAFALGV